MIGEKEMHGLVKVSVKTTLKKQFEQELSDISKLIDLLGIPVSAEELVEFSGLTVSRYSVKGHDYLKLIGVLTGEKSDKVEEWLVKKKGENTERKRKLRKKMIHLLNLKDSEENRINIGWLVHYWRRAKALKKWLEEVERFEA